MLITRKDQKLNNRAFTLVEVICAVAILAIISFSIVGFITISSHSFKESSKEVNLQYDAQQAVNQIKDMIMDSNRAVYSYVSDTGSEETFLVLNEKATGDALAPYEYPAIKIWFVPADNKIYYASYTFSYSDLKDKYEDSSHTTVAMKELGEAITTTNAAILVDHVSSFLVDDSVAETKGEVKISLGLTIGESSYVSKSTVVMRNKVIASDNVAEIFDGTRHVRSSGRVNSVKILMGAVDVTSQTLDYDNGSINKPKAPEGGGTSFATYTFSAVVDAIELGTDVTWTLEGSSVVSGLNSDISNGVVRVSSDETATSLKITARSKADITKSADVVLKIPIYDMSLGYASGISLDLTKKEQNQLEETYTFKVTPTFENADKVADKDYTYSLVNRVTGEVYSGAGLSKSGDKIVFKCDATDSLKNYMLTVLTNAVDAYGNKKSATYNIDVSTLLTADQIGPKAEINANELQLSRNSNYEIALTTSNISTDKIDWVEWKIVDKVGFSNQYYYGDYLVSFKSSDKKSGKLNVDKTLAWGGSFSFKVKATVHYRDNENRNKTVDSNELQFTVSPVTVAISTNEATILHNTIESRFWGLWEYSDTLDKSVNITVNNISGIDTGNIKIKVEKDKADFSVKSISGNTLNMTYRNLEKGNSGNGNGNNSVTISVIFGYDKDWYGNFSQSVTSNSITWTIN